MKPIAKELKKLIIKFLVLKGKNRPDVEGEIRLLDFYRRVKEQEVAKKNLLMKQVYIDTPIEMFCLEGINGKNAASPLLHSAVSIILSRLPLSDKFVTK